MDAEPSEASRVEAQLSTLTERIDSLTRYVISARWATTDLTYQLLGNRAVTCRICGHADGAEKYRTHDSECQFLGGRLLRYVCPECDVVFGPIKMLDLSPAQLDAEYRVLYETYREANSTEYEIRSFKACQPERGSLSLNWGCGAWAETIDVLRAEGWDTWGYEPNAPTDSPFVAGSIGSISAKFDTIFSNNVLEHLTDPIAEFRLMRSILKPGGVMTHSTPCYDLSYENTRFHLFFFLGRSVEALAERSGFEIVDRENDGEYRRVTFRATSTED